MAPAKYKDESWLRSQYWDKGRTLKDMGEECGVSRSTITDWMDKYGIERRSNSDAQQPDGKYTQEQWLRKQYVTEERSLHDIAAECGVTAATVLKWARRFDIERRGTAEHLENNSVAFQISDSDLGRLPGGWIRYGVKIGERYKQVKEHQLVAIREGADPHKVFSGGEFHVHHKNGIRWDNRPENLELMDGGKHIQHHTKERQRTETGEFQ